MFIKIPANQSSSKEREEKENQFLPKETNNSIQIDYLKLIASLQEAMLAISMENKQLKETLLDHTRELEQLRLRTLRLEASVSKQPLLKVIKQTSE
jgi:predicted RNase H-like nuclease (RuvC/YqgF family)